MSSLTCFTWVQRILQWPRKLRDLALTTTCTSWVEEDTLCRTRRTRACLSSKLLCTNKAKKELLRMITQNTYLARGPILLVKLEKPISTKTRTILTCILAIEKLNYMTRASWTYLDPYSTLFPQISATRSLHQPLTFPSLNKDEKRLATTLTPKFYSTRRRQTFFRRLWTKS